jgi:acetyl esterase
MSHTMPLDPQAKVLLDQLAAAGGKGLHGSSPEEARQMFALLGSLGGTPEEVGAVSDRTVPGPAGEIPVRVYTPREGTAPHPIVMFFHGGGFVIGDLDTHDQVCRSLANGSRAMVVAVDYRLAPEHPYPAAPDDCWAATTWVAEHGAELGGDPTRMAVAGDSAGGNLAAVVAQQARDSGGPPLKSQVLIYPATDLSMLHPSITENGEGYLLTKEGMEWFMGHYAPDVDHVRCSPLAAIDLSGLPPALVITAEFDPLRDEGEAYAEHLREAGVPVVLTRYDGMIHGFFQLGFLMDAGTKAVDEAARALGAALA